jgi:hypothetical protein
MQSKYLPSVSSSPLNRENSYNENLHRQDAHIRGISDGTVDCLTLIVAVECSNSNRKAKSA